MKVCSDYLADLLGLLRLERLERNLFRGESRDIGSPQVYGGQVLGQALSAAQQTIEERKAHSLHAYFLRAGDPAAPIVYEVERARDGRSFSSRRVVAIQHGRPILNLAASFQREEEGLAHQDEAPVVPTPAELPELTVDSLRTDALVPGKIQRILARQRPFEFRLVPPEFYDAAHPAPRLHVWMRTGGRVPDDPTLHRALLAYVSDYALLMTALLPHGDAVQEQQLKVASLDHAMWFHRETRVDEWLLYSCDSPSAGGARGLSRGQIFDRQGSLVASTIQEGLMRLGGQKEPSQVRAPAADS